MRAGPRRGYRGRTCLTCQGTETRGRLLPYKGQELVLGLLQRNFALLHSLSKARLQKKSRASQISDTPPPKTLPETLDGQSSALRVPFAPQRAQSTPRARCVGDPGHPRPAPAGQLPGQARETRRERRRSPGRLWGLGSGRAGPSSLFQAGRSPPQHRAVGVNKQK